jgi:hypothetical protein
MTKPSRSQGSEPSDYTINGRKRGADAPAIHTKMKTDAEKLDDVDNQVITNRCFNREKNLEAENAKLKEYFNGIYETALNWEKQNERLSAEARRQNDAAKYYCDLMLKYQGERDKARKENAKLRKSRDKLAENLAERTLWTDKDRNKDKVKQSWIEWSEEKE